MDSAVLAAVITGLAVIVAAALPHLRQKAPPATASERVPSAMGTVSSRRVFFQGIEHRFLNFGAKHSRIQRLDGGESFLVPTSGLYHDAGRELLITRDSIVARP